MILLGVGSTVPKLIWLLYVHGGKCVLLTGLFLAEHGIPCVLYRADITKKNGETHIHTDMVFNFFKLD